MAVGAGGAIVGGAIGYATEGVDGILEGALNEFSKPIIKSSIVGSAGFINDIFKKLRKNSRGGR